MVAVIIEMRRIVMAILTGLGAIDSVIVIDRIIIVIVDNIIYKFEN
jgi:hypothetical protein